MTMSTATLPAAGPIGVHHHSFWRFAWKEYRMLRGFWLAVAVLAVLIQLIALATLTRADELAEMLFSVALGATVLYAVGAAATLFAVEHEEETYDLLTTLPVEWPPAFFAKLFVATLSSLAMLVVLVGCALVMGGIWDSDVAYLLLPAITEVIAWGIFMSLVIRRPLVAAVATIAVVSAQVNVLMSFVSEWGLSIRDASNYPSILPWRLAIVAVVLLIDLALGREWLRVPKTKRSKAVASSQAKTVAVQSPASGNVSTLRMMSRLLWQTWRESWVAMALMILFAAVLGVFGVLALIGIGNSFIPSSSDVAIYFSFAMILSAVYASGVFASDQRGRSHRFLAEHCARPRLVWFCRQAVWSSVLLAIVLIAATLTAMVQADAFLTWAKGEARASIETGTYYHWDPHRLLMNRLTDTQSFIDQVTVLLLGIAGGYGVGQLCSILFRSSLVAGFASIVAASSFTLWGLLLWVWSVPGGWAFAFVPIAMGLLLASWLRAPDWIVERYSIMRWVSMISAVVLPLIFGAWYVSHMRVAEIQIRNSNWRRWYQPHFETARDYRDDPAAKAFAEELIRVAETTIRPEKPEGKRIDPETGIKHLDAQQSAAWYRDYIELNRDSIDKAIELSNTPALAFSERTSQEYSIERLRDLAALLTIAGNVYTRDGELDEALTAYLASLRILGHARRDVGSNYYGVFSREESGVLTQLRDWSTHDSQTTERLLDAIEQLNLIIPTTPEQWQLAKNRSGYLPSLPTNTSDYKRLRNVIEDPTTGRTAGKSALKYMAFLANKLTFERERGLRVLDHVEAMEWMRGGQQLQEIMVDEWAGNSGSGGTASQEPSRELRSAISAARRREQAQWDFRKRDLLSEPWSWLSTTYFLDHEYNLLTSFANYLIEASELYAKQRATKLQMALMAYRLDHRIYPAELDDLVPDYLASVPVDPYAGAPFQYEPEGLRGILSISSQNTLPPNTPFFWSVGHDYARLDGGITTLPPRDEDADDPSLWKKRWYYRFEGRQGYSGSPLVFPLPPIPAAESTGAMSLCTASHLTS